MKPVLRALAGGAVLASALVTAGCLATGPKLAPLNLSEPGWRLQETAAVWIPKTDGPQLVGELLVALHPDGRRWIQFSKQTMPVVSARQTPEAWEISSSLSNARHSGRGQPPARVLWLQLDGLPPGRVTSPWSLENRADGSWRLSNPRTGESLDAAPAAP
jgi:hypothetical protein